MSIQDFHAKLGPQSPAQEFAPYRSLGQNRVSTVTRQSKALEWEPWPER